MKSEGKCTYCKKIITATAMPKHLLACKERMKAHSGGKKDIFLIRASAGPFFVYFEVCTNDTMESVDDFLRDIWLILK